MTRMTRRMGWQAKFLFKKLQHILNRRMVFAMIPHKRQFSARFSCWRALEARYCPPHPIKSGLQTRSMPNAHAALIHSNKRIYP